MEQTLHQCPECGGTGEVSFGHINHFVASVPCENCDGTGWLDEHGEPFYLEPEIKDDYANQ